MAKLRELPGKLEAAERRAVQAEVVEAAQDVRRDAPVLSGALRDSVQSEVLKGGLSGRVAVTARHAQFVLHGTSDTVANDFVAASIARAQQRFPKRLRDELRDEIKRM